MSTLSVSVWCYVTMAILIRHSAPGSIVCLTGIKATTALNQTNITIYQLKGKLLVLHYVQNHSGDRLTNYSMYSWTTDPPTAKDLFTPFKNRFITQKMNEAYDNVNVRYQKKMPTGTTFTSAWATLRLGAGSKISRNHDEVTAEVDSSLDVCFNVSGSPMPSLTIHRGSENLTDDESTRPTIDASSNCLRWRSLKENDTGPITVSAENCYARVNITINLTVIKRPTVPTTELVTWTRRETSTTPSPMAEEDNSELGLPIWVISLIAVFTVVLLLILLITVFCLVIKIRSTRIPENSGARSKVAVEGFYAEPEKVNNLSARDVPKPRHVSMNSEMAGYETVYPSTPMSSKRDESSNSRSVAKELNYAELDTSVMKERSDSVQESEKVKYASLNAEQPKQRDWET